MKRRLLSFCNRLWGASGRATGTNSVQRPEMFEALESRRVFSTDFAYVGMHYPAGDAPVMIVWGEGTRSDTGGVTGTSNSLRWGGSVTSGASDIESMSFSNGGMTLVYSGDHTVDSVYGADFRMGPGYQHGFFGLAGSNGKDARFFAEQRSHDLIWSDRYYNFSITRLTADGISTINASIRFTFPPPTRPPSPAYDPTGALISYNGGAEEQRAITSITADGVITLSSGEILYFTDNSNPHVPAMSSLSLGVGDPRTANFLYVDPNAADGAIGVGTGSLEYTDQYIGGLDGVYRGSVLLNNPTGMAFFKDGDTFQGPTSAEFVLAIYRDGTFEMFTPESHASQTPESFRNGTWTTSAQGKDIVLEDSAGNLAARFRVAPTRAITAVSVTSISGDEASTSAVTGVLQQYAGTLEEKFSIVSDVFLTSDGSAEVLTYVEGSDGSIASTIWTRFDLQDRAGGFALTHVLLTKHPFMAGATFSGSVPTSPYVDLITGIDTRGHVVSYERSYAGDWSYRDITAELNAAALESNTTAFSFWKFDAVNTENGEIQVPVHLAPFVYGVDENGAHVAFRPVSEYNRNNTLAFERIDLSAALVASGSAAPDFSGGSITGFTSPWGSINVIGLNAEGHVEALWTSPGFGWYANDLTDAAGGTAMQGQLTANFTTWHALNVFGMDDQGHIDVLWWTPESGRWIASDLTSDFDLTPMSMTGVQKLVDISNYAFGAIAVGGLTAEGHVVMYWWAVGMTGWSETDLTAADPEERAPTQLLSAGFTADYTYTHQFVWGRASDGDIVRYHWSNLVGDPWMYENITDVALVQ
jgi:hypothetical protein